MEELKAFGYKPVEIKVTKWFLKQDYCCLEPYEKSLALKLHSDAINNPLEESRNDKVSFDNYGGVSPRKYAELFSMHNDRKENNKLIRRSFDKEKLDPLNAQESVTFKSRLRQFKQWFDQEFFE